MARKPPHAGRAERVPFLHFSDLERPMLCASRTALRPHLLGRLGQFALLGLLSLLASCSHSPPPPAPASSGGSTEAPAPAAPQELAVAAASDLRFVLDDLLAEFHRQHPEIRVQTTFGASGSLFAQIENGAPFDLFLSADLQYPQLLAARGQAAEAVDRGGDGGKGGDGGPAESAVFPYAVGHLVLWVPQDSPVDVERNGIQALLDSQIRRIALANPRVAPYGRAAEAALRKLGVYDAVQSKLVVGENVSQAAQYVDRGGADAGLLSRSLVLSPALRDKGRYWLVPEDAHPPLLQGGVILRRCRAVAAAWQLQAFLTSDEARPLFARYGFDAP